MARYRTWQNECWRPLGTYALAYNNICHVIIYIISISLIIIIINLIIINLIIINIVIVINASALNMTSSFTVCHVG